MSGFRKIMTCALVSEFSSLQALQSVKYLICWFVPKTSEIDTSACITDQNISVQKYQSSMVKKNITEPFGVNLQNMLMPLTNHPPHLTLRYLFIYTTFVQHLSIIRFSSKFFVFWSNFKTHHDFPAGRF